MLDNELKLELIKICTRQIKELRGTGARNIHIKYQEQELQIIINGMLSKAERAMIQTFGTDYIEAIKPFYLADSANQFKVFKQELMRRYPEMEEEALTLKHAEIDFIEDICIYKVAHKMKEK